METETKQRGIQHGHTVTLDYVVVHHSVVGPTLIGHIHDRELYNWPT